MEPSTLELSFRAAAAHEASSFRASIALGWCFRLSLAQRSGFSFLKAVLDARLVDLKNIPSYPSPCRSASSSRCTKSRRRSRRTSPTQGQTASRDNAKHRGDGPHDGILYKNQFPLIKLRGSVQYARIRIGESERIRWWPWYFRGSRGTIPLRPWRPSTAKTWRTSKLSTT